MHSHFQLFDSFVHPLLCMYYGSHDKFTSRFLQWAFIFQRNDTAGKNKHRNLAYCSLGCFWFRSIKYSCETSLARVHWQRIKGRGKKEKRKCKSANRGEWSFWIVEQHAGPLSVQNFAWFCRIFNYYVLCTVKSWRYSIYLLQTHDWLLVRSFFLFSPSFLLSPLIR